MCAIYVWAVILFVLGIFTQARNNSLFPEIDFASKCVGTPTDGSQSMVKLLGPLSNADSSGIRSALAGKWLALVESNLPEYGNSDGETRFQIRVVPLPEGSGILESTLTSN